MSQTEFETRAFCIKRHFWANDETEKSIHYKIYVEVLLKFLGVPQESKFF
jgi:hypothetical protein